MPTCTACSLMSKVREPFWRLARKRGCATLTAPAHSKTHTQGESYEYRYADQSWEAYQSHPASTSADSRYGLGTASLPHQPPLLVSSTWLLLSLVLRDLGPADPTHAQSRGCQSAV